MPGLEVKQGASIGLRFGIKEGMSLVGWKCRVMVKSDPADVIPLVDLNLNTLTAEQDQFTGLITRSTTEGLDPADYMLMADIWNESTGEAADEIHVELRISQQGVQ